jgi:hypothetical protein
MSKRKIVDKMHGLNHQLWDTERYAGTKLITSMVYGI